MGPSTVLLHALRHPQLRLSGDKNIKKPQEKIDTRDVRILIAEPAACYNSLFMVRCVGKRGRILPRVRYIFRQYG